MTVYIKVPEIVKDCDGCAAASRDNKAACTRLSASLANTPNKGCNGVIWIEDTEAARLEYITLKLES